MKKYLTFILVTISFLLSLVFDGCLYKEKTEAIPTNVIAPSSDNGSLLWIEFDGRFYTKDKERAQAEIPFTLILPSYIPEIIRNISPPEIDGPLQKNPTDNKIRVNIRYPLYPDTKKPSIIIQERNHAVFIGDSSADSELKFDKINENQVIYKAVDFGLGPGIWFNFNISDIYFIVEIYDLSYEESAKIVESMIK